MAFSVSNAFCFALSFLPTTAIAAPVRPSTPKPASARISFVNDVIPALTRAGCNSGSCHGAAAGKNGFHLSLRGYAPELDYHYLATQFGGRRVCKTEPEKSLLLRKILLEVPHMGGKVVRKGSAEHRILLGWLAQGAPGPEAKDPHVTALKVTPPAQEAGKNAALKLTVQAVFSDGTKRDVTHWARFETNDQNIATVGPGGAVRTVGPGETSIMVGYQDRVAIARIAVPYPNKIDPKAYSKLPRANYIDDLVISKMASLRLLPSGQASDVEYMRRVCLDLTGTLPTADEVRKFAADTGALKREKLVDALLDKPEFISFWTYKWSDLLRVNRGTLKDKGMWAFHAYIHDSVRDNKPWDVMAREVLTAKGNTFLDGPANYFRTALKPEELAENVTQGFMGIRVQCAKCHNHPLEKWTQNEYYGMAQVFARTKFKADLSIYANDEMTVYNVSSGDLIQPRLGKAVPPKPLGGPTLAMDSPRERRSVFAEWLTKPDNWYFSHSIVNRVWAHFMGRGLVEPVDDLRETNPPTNPALFDALTKDFVQHKFDLKHLMRRIVTSAAYQRSASPLPQNAADKQFYSRYFVKRLTAEGILDALCQVTGVPEQFPGMPPGYRAIDLPDTHVKSEFMDSFGRPPRQITCECERSQEPNMTQALLFINGDLINKKVTAEGSLVDRLMKTGKPDPQVLDELYWTALGRPPKPVERASNLAALKRAMAVAPAGAANVAEQKVDPAIARRKAFEDLLWVLVNSKEFLFNH
jgi:hypothetical protein